MSKRDWTRAALTRDGFLGWVPWSACPAGLGTIDPAAGGVYVVYRPELAEPVFLERSPAGTWRGDPTVSRDALEANWVPGAQVLNSPGPKAGWPVRTFTSASPPAATAGPPPTSSSMTTWSCGGGRSPTPAISPGDDWNSYWSWLVDQQMARPEDRPEFDRHFTDTARKTATPRPGLWLSRRWPLKEAEQLDSRAAFAPAVRGALDQALHWLGEPRLAP